MSALASARGVKSRFTLAACLLCAGCHSKAGSTPAGSASALSSAQAKPLDRLASDELAAGNADVWGFAVPRDMKVEHRYVETAHLVGPVKPDALANYVRDRVIVSHVEIGAGRTVFPDARIKGGAADRVYELDVVPEPGQTRLVIKDTTPMKVTPGLTDAERWQQAGLTPEGRPLDPKKFE
ncbi:MAG TPA: hypothetical protein VHW01_08930 [Polyangiaceae bacterium]|jgi:hypothetical protein|nr:hypothetical protein [Polyangiaceae bacterium]